jgi:hypothetical protein
MPKFFSVLFLILFSFSAFAQSSLLEYGPSNVSGKSIVEAPMAPITYLNQPPDAQNGFFADTCWSSGQQSIADNFTVTAAGPTYGITEIKFWGGYFSEDIPNAADNFTIILHSDAGGAPGANIYARHNLQATSRVQTGLILFGTHEYLFTLNLSASPMMMPNTGTYWIEIYNCSTLSDAFYWETGTLDATHGVSGNNWSQTTPGVLWNGPTGLESSIQINGDDNVIPVELASFTANASEGIVELSWITATETNNQGFEIQRSNDGEFETIAFVEGHGTTTETQAYAYSDREVNSGIYTYRLKQVDFDGTFEYSNIVEVDVPFLKEYALEQNYPNPFNPSTQIAFRLAVDSKVSLKVFDVLGQEVATLVNTNLVAGAQTVNFDASALNSGVYLYRIEAAGIDGTNFIDVKKMILTK